MAAFRHPPHHSPPTCGWLPLQSRSRPLLQDLLGHTHTRLTDSSSSMTGAAPDPMAVEGFVGVEGSYCEEELWEL